MNLAILRKERSILALRWGLPLIALVSVAWGTFQLGLPGLFDAELASGGPSRPSTPSPWGSYFLIFAPLQMALSLLCFIQLRHRVVEHEHALPIAFHDLVMTRSLGAFLTIAAPVIVTILATIPFLPESIPLAAHLLVGLNLISAAFLFIGLSFHWRPNALSLSIFEVLLLALIGIAAAALPFLLDAPWLWAAYVATGALVFFSLHSRLRSATPDQRLLVNRARMETPTSGSRELRLSPLTLTLVRSTVLRPAGIAVLLATLVILLISGAAPTIILFFGPWGIFLSWQYGRTSLSILQGLDPLPIPRRKILPYVIFPPLVTLVLATSLAGTFARGYYSWQSIAKRVHVDRTSAKIIGRRGEFRNHVLVPAHLWELHRGDEPVEITAPWGESVQAESHPFYPGSPFFAYNPFDVSDASSARFLAWQLSRAHEKATGTARTADDFERLIREVHAKNAHHLAEAETVADLQLSTCLSAHSKEHPLPAELAFLDSANCRLRHESDPTQTLPVPNGFGFQAGWVTLVWTATMTFLLRRNLPPRTKARWKTKLVIQTSAAIIAVLLVGAIYRQLSADPAPYAVLVAFVHRSLNDFFGSNPLAWAASLLVLLGLSWMWLRHRFERIEVPPLLKMGMNKKKVSAF